MLQITHVSLLVNIIWGLLYYIQKKNDRYAGGVVPEPSRGVGGHAPPADLFLYPLHWNA